MDSSLSEISKWRLCLLLLFFAFYSLDKECNGVAFQHQSTGCGQIFLVQISPRHGKNNHFSAHVCDVIVIMRIRRKSYMWNTLMKVFLGGGGGWGNDHRIWTCAFVKGGLRKFRLQPETRCLERAIDENVCCCRSFWVVVLYLYAAGVSSFVG